MQEKIRSDALAKTAKAPDLRNVCLSVLALTALGVFALVLVFSVTWRHTGVYARISGPVELVSRAQFDIKMAQFAAQSGPKIAVLGDSFVYGAAMADAVGPDWRAFGLDSALARCLSERRAEGTGRPLHVANFGNNGLLPADLSVIADHVMAAGADLVLINVNVRSLSQDFNTEQDQFRYAWLRNEENGTDFFDRTLASLELAKTMYIDHEVAVLDNWIDARLDRILARSVDLPRDDTPDFGELNVLLQLKRRISTSTFDTDQSIQAAELADLLAQPSVYGFQIEMNPQLVRTVMDAETRNRLDEELVRFNAETGDKILVAPQDLQHEDFIDLLHVLPSGYEKYAATLCAQIAERGLL